MSHYSTSYITQGGDLFAILKDNANPPAQVGMVQAKAQQYNPPNYRKLNAFKHIDNEFFLVKNPDRKISQLLLEWSFTQHLLKDKTKADCLVRSAKQ